MGPWEDIDYDYMQGISHKQYTHQGDFIVNSYDLYVFAQSHALAGIEGELPE